MSTTFNETTAALQANPELAKKVMAVGTPAERAEILRAAGLTPPTHAEVNAAHKELSDVSGAGNTLTNAAITVAVVSSSASAVAAS